MLVFLVTPPFFFVGGGGNNCKPMLTGGGLSAMLLANKVQNQRSISIIDTTTLHAASSSLTSRVSKKEVSE